MSSFEDDVQRLTVDARDTRKALRMERAARAREAASNAAMVAIIDAMIAIIERLTAALATSRAECRALLAARAT